MDIKYINSQGNESSDIIGSLESMNFGGKFNKRNKEEKKRDKKEKKESKKQAKKQDKKDTSIDEDIPNSLNAPIDDIDEFISDEELDDGMRLATRIAKGEFDDSDDSSISDDIANKEKRKYGKRKKSKDEYNRVFAEEITMLYDLRSTVSKISKDIEAQVKTSAATRRGGVSKTHADMVSNLLSAKMNELQIIKELNSTKKTIAELNLKEQAAKAKTEGAADNNNALVASTYLQQVMNAGRNNVIQSLRGTSKPAFLVDAYSNDDEEDDGTILSLAGNTHSYTDKEHFAMNDFMMDRLEDEEYKMRTEDGNKLIQYENMGVRVCIQLDIATDEYQFIALDRDDQIVHDYPLPQNPGKIKFAGKSATDRYSNVYEVIEYDSSAFED